MEGKSSYFILLVIVAFLSITLAFLAIGFFFFGNGSSGAEKEVVLVTEKILTEEDLVLETLFETKNFNLKKTNENQIAVISVSCSLKHLKEAEGLNEEQIASKIDFYSKEIVSEIGTYFQGLTLEDVGKDDAKQKASEEMKKRINEILSEGKSDEEPLVYSVIFEYWFYQ